MSNPGPAHASGVLAGVVGRVQDFLFPAGRVSSQVLMAHEKINFISEYPGIVDPRDIDEAMQLLGLALKNIAGQDSSGAYWKFIEENSPGGEKAPLPELVFGGIDWREVFLHTYEALDSMPVRAFPDMTLPIKKPLEHILEAVGALTPLNSLDLASMSGR